MFNFDLFGQDDREPDELVELQVSAWQCPEQELRIGGLLIVDPAWRLKVASTFTTIYTRTELRKPTAAWSFTDDAGHVHRYDLTGQRAYFGSNVSTLEAYTVHHDCDGNHTAEYLAAIDVYDIPESPCEGTDETRFRCRQCGQDIEPGSYGTGQYSAHVPGPRNFTGQFRTNLDDYAQLAGWHRDPVTGRVQIPMVGSTKPVALTLAATGFADGSRLDLTGTVWLGAPDLRFGSRGWLGSGHDLAQADPKVMESESWVEASWSGSVEPWTWTTPVPAVPSA